MTNDYFSKMEFQIFFQNLFYSDFISHCHCCYLLVKNKETKTSWCKIVSVVERKKIIFKNDLEFRMRLENEGLQNADIVKALIESEKLFCSLLDSAT